MNLNGQLTSRGQNQNACDRGLLGLIQQPLQHGQHKGCRLTRAGRSARTDVASEQGNGHGGRLNRGRLNELHLGQGLQKGIVLCLIEKKKNSPEKIHILSQDNLTQIRWIGLKKIRSKNYV